MNEEMYRVEFNEQQQLFHLDKGDHKENTKGWFTVFDSLTYKDFMKYRSFVIRTKKGNITENHVFNCAIDFYSRNLKDKITK